MTGARPWTEVRDGLLSGTITNDKQDAADLIDTLAALVSDFKLGCYPSCKLDVHGHCRVHLWYEDRPCPHARAKEMGL